MKFTDRTDQMKCNNFGSEMKIIAYRGTNDIDIYFPKYNWTYKNTTYTSFKSGQIKCPYERRYFGIGYLGEGDAPATLNGKTVKAYDLWRNMLRRCYDKEFHKKESTYKDCEVCEEWMNYNNFYEWFKENYYEIKGEKIQLDKDILRKRNKIYSSDNCVFVTHKINSLFCKSDSIRGDLPIGVCYHKSADKYMARCFDGNNNAVYIGVYDNPSDAFNEYKKYKELIIKRIADEYKDEIPSKLYNALYNYEVEITD